jgi:hypothetical protein
MPIGAALRLIGSRGTLTLTLTSQKPIVTIESYRPQTIRQCLSWVHFRKSPQFCTEPALTQRTDIPGPELHVRKVLHCSRNTLKVEFQFRQCATLPIRSLSQQRPALTGPEGCGLPV